MKSKQKFNPFLCSFAVFSIFVLMMASITIGLFYYIFSIPEPEDCVRVQAKLRYRQREQWAMIRPAGDGAVVLEFDAPQRAVTPGQAAVFYDGDLVVGGGTIVSAWNREEEAAE